MANRDHSPPTLDKRAILVGMIIALFLALATCFIKSRAVGHSTPAQPLAPPTHRG
jgi:hypothetical protein